MRNYHHFKYGLLITLLLASFPTSSLASNSVKANPSNSINKIVVEPSVTINGNSYTFKGMLPTIKGGTLFVPVELFEHVDIQADITKHISKAYSSVFISHFNGAISIYPDQSEYVFNDLYIKSSDVKMKWNSLPPYLIDDDFMVPLRVLAEQMGLSVSWDITTNTANINSNAEYQAELESPEEWEAWQGTKPIALDDPSGKPITKDELMEYTKSTGLLLLDSKIIDKYTAEIICIEEEDGVKSLMYTTVDRLKNGGLGWRVSIHSDENEEDVQVKRNGNLVSVGMFEQGLKRRFTHFEISYITHGVRESIKYDITGKQGLIVEIPLDVTGGSVIFYGKRGYMFSSYFF